MANGAHKNIVVSKIMSGPKYLWNATKTKGFDLLEKETHIHAVYATLLHYICFSCIILYFVFVFCICSSVTVHNISLSIVNWASGIEITLFIYRWLQV